MVVLTMPFTWKEHAKHPTILYQQSCGNKLNSTPKTQKLNLCEKHVMRNCHKTKSNKYITELIKNPITQNIQKSKL
jgi:hypothetical protein